MNIPKLLLKEEGVIMEGFSKLKAHLDTFQKNRQEAKLSSPSKREDYAKVIEKCFLESAQGILAGYFIVFSKEGGKTVVREIHPTAIELYYHEEGAGRFKDPIMYHTNDRKRADHPDFFEKRGIDSIPYFPVGSVNPHTSGIDITFENPKHEYRASFLIREYKVKYESGKELLVRNSTEIYDDMLIKGLQLEEADWVEWHDGEKVEEDRIERCWRRNVSDYVEVSLGNWRKNTDIEEKEHFTISGVKYVKCPFKWQFKVKK